MKSFIPFQKLCTLYLGSGGGTIVQSPLGHLDASERTSLDLHVEIFNLTGTLVLEGSVSEGGPWEEVESWVSTDDDVTLNLMTYYSAQNPLARLLRWRFSHTTTGKACFRIRYQ